jgi:hypothetical protein
VEVPLRGQRLRGGDESDLHGSIADAQLLDPLETVASNLGLDPSQLAHRKRAPAQPQPIGTGHEKRQSGAMTLKVTGERRHHHLNDALPVEADPGPPLGWRPP